MLQNSRISRDSAHGNKEKEGDEQRRSKERKGPKPTTGLQNVIKNLFFHRHPEDTAHGGGSGWQKKRSPLR
jgi:hypothetical protein